MSNYLDIKTLANLVHIKRGKRGLREIAEIAGVSASTLSRVEREQIPDIETFLALCDWLEVPPSTLIKNTEDTSEKDISRSICTMLRSDKKLNPEVAIALAVLIEAAYSKQL